MKWQTKNQMTYFKLWGFSINEGGMPVNIHMSWKHGFYFYLYFFGYKFYKHIGGRGKQA